MIFVWILRWTCTIRWCILHCRRHFYLSSAKSREQWLGETGPTLFLQPISYPTHAPYWSFRLPYVWSMHLSVIIYSETCLMRYLCNPFPLFTPLIICYVFTLCNSTFRLFRQKKCWIKLFLWAGTSRPIILNKNLRSLCVSAGWMYNLSVYIYIFNGLLIMHTILYFLCKEIRWVFQHLLFLYFV